MTTYARPEDRDIPPTTATAAGRVRHVLFNVPLRPGSLSLVEMEDGSLRVLMNDQPLTGCHWHPGQVPTAVDRFLEIKSTLAARRNEPVH